VRNHGDVPDVDPEAWRLEVDGLVGRPLRLSLAELRARFAPRKV
jgi:sulfite oxidase